MNEWKNEWQNDNQSTKDSPTCRRGKPNDQFWFDYWCILTVSEWYTLNKDLFENAPPKSLYGLSNITFDCTCNSKIELQTLQTCYSTIHGSWDKPSLEISSANNNLFTHRNLLER